MHASDTGRDRVLAIDGLVTAPIAWLLIRALWRCKNADWPYSKNEYVCDMSRRVLLMKNRKNHVNNFTHVL